MPKRRPAPQRKAVERHPTVVVVDGTLATLLGLPRLELELLRHGALGPYLEQTVQRTTGVTGWLNTLREWILTFQPTVISLSPDLVLDRLLFQSFIAPQSYGFGTPVHVPALCKPNGCLNWFTYITHKGPEDRSAWLSLEKNNIGCHPDLETLQFPQFPETSLAVDLPTESNVSVFDEVRKFSRRRLELAQDVLLLGLNADDLRVPDVHLLRELSPRRLTVVAPTPTQAGRISKALAPGRFTDLELGSPDHWITNRSFQWASV